MGFLDQPPHEKSDLEKNDHTDGRPSLCNRLVGFTKTVIKICAAIFALYLFICSLSLLSNAFKILGGRKVSTLFSSSELLSNPIVGVMIGILVTVLVQSSSTSTSIIVSLVSVGLDVKYAVPMIFGSNIGTSVTNTIVSIGQVGDRETFGRAFSAATVHDMFNWLTVVIMLIFESSFGFLQSISHEIVTALLATKTTNNEDGQSASLTSRKAPNLLKPLTKPFIDSVVMLDKKVLIGWSVNDTAYAEVTSVLKQKCKCPEGGSAVAEYCECKYLLSYLSDVLSDTWIGSILLVTSIILLCTCLFTLVKLLHSMLGPKMKAIVMARSMAEESKLETGDSTTQSFYSKWVSGYVSILVGALVTMMVNSSSIFTSVMTPICGAGLVSLETMYPLTLGSNIGTTATSLVAALAVDDPEYFQPSLQIALVHLLFNISGILIFYPIPFMRLPLPMARFLGRITSKYRWFALLYLFTMFGTVPVLVFVASLIDVKLLYVITGLIISGLVAILLINTLQKYCSKVLPNTVREFECSSILICSLDSMDKVVVKFMEIGGYKNNKKKNNMTITNSENFSSVVFATTGKSGDPTAQHTMVMCDRTKV